MACDRCQTLEKVENWTASHSYFLLQVCSSCNFREVKFTDLLTNLSSWVSSVLFVSFDMNFRFYFLVKLTLQGYTYKAYKRLTKTAQESIQIFLFLIRCAKKKNKMAVAVFENRKAIRHISTFICRQPTFTFAAKHELSVQLRCNAASMDSKKSDRNVQFVLCTYTYIRHKLFPWRKRHFCTGLQTKNLQLS